METFIIGLALLITIFLAPIIIIIENPMSLFIIVPVVALIIGSKFYQKDEDQ